MMYHTPESPVKKLKFLLQVLLLPMAVYASSKIYVKDYGLVVNKPVHVSLNPATPARNTFLPGSPDESHSSLPPQQRDTTGKRKKVPGLAVGGSGCFMTSAKKNNESFATARLQ